MKILHGIVLFSLSLVTSAFGAASDAARNGSEMMNATQPSRAEGTPGGVRVVFLGNSITLHTPLPSIGWTSDWGMAASAREKDYVHLVARAITEKTGRPVDLRICSLADFERNYRTWNVEKRLADLAAFRPEYLVVALGENVPNLASAADADAFRNGFARVLACFRRDGAMPRTVVRGVFWKNEVKDEQMRRAAQAAGVTFVRTDFADDPTMKALGLFSHEGVQNHPGDKGMAETAARIVAALFPAGSAARSFTLYENDATRRVDGPLHLDTTAAVMIDLGPDGEGGYPEIVATPVKGQPKVRLSYGCYPAFGNGGDFTRETSARYLGQDVDLPILPANINRFDVFAVTNAGTYGSVLQQGLLRYVRVQLEEPGTAVDLHDIRFVNRGTHSEEPVVGRFACSDERLNALWKASVRTCQLAAIPARTTPLHLVTPDTNVVLGTTYDYLSDGAKRDRLVWSGDLWWAQFNMYAAFGPASPYMPGSLRMLAENQTPAGYVQACPYPESHGPLADGVYGPFPSDEFAAWFVPVLAAHYLHTGDRAMAEELYPNVKRLMGYLAKHTREDFVFEQRAETSKHANGLAFGTSSVHHRSFINVLLWRTFRDAATLADAVGSAADAADWRARAARYAAVTREKFFLPSGLLRTSLEDGNPGNEATTLALGTAFFTPDEAKRALAALPRVGHGKFQMLIVRGAFHYGDPDAALARIAQHGWFGMVDPAYRGIHTTSECMVVHKDCGWGDEAHPDTAIAGDLTAGVLGIVPLEPGYRRFAFRPGAAKSLDWAEGVVPTPAGLIKASWRRVNGKVERKLECPPSLTCAE